GQIGSAVSSSLFPSGGTPPYTITGLTPLPPGFALETGASLLTTGPTAVLSGVPQAPGIYTFTLRADDSAGNYGVRTGTLTVVPFTLFTTTALADASVGTAYSQPRLVWSPAAAPTGSISPTSAMPPGLTVSSSGVISGTPLQPGLYSFVLVATDGVTPVNFTFSLRVSAITILGPSV